MPGSRFAFLPTVQQAGHLFNSRACYTMCCPKWSFLHAGQRLQCGFHAGGSGYDALGREIGGEIPKAQALGECCFHRAECFMP